MNKYSATINTIMTVALVGICAAAILISYVVWTHQPVVEQPPVPRMLSTE